MHDDVMPARRTLVFAAGLALGGWAPLAFAQQPGAPPAPVVEVGLVRAERVAPTVELLGTLEPLRTSLVAASIEGYVIDFPAKEGMWVESGAVLARLRDDIFQLELSAARAALAEAQEQQAKAKLDLARVETIVAQDAASRKLLDEARSAERVAALRVPQAEAKIGILESNIAKKTVRAPFAGQIVREATELGQWLPPGGAVAQVVDISRLRVRAHVPERQIRFLAEGQTLAIEVPEARTRQRRGRTVSIAAAGDPSARTFAVLVEIENPGRELRAAMRARVAVPADEPHDGLLVPKDAVRQQAGRDFVYVVRDGSAELRTVRLGEAVGGDFEVRDGLSAGEQVVTRGNERVQPGPVRIVSSDGEAAPKGPRPPPGAPSDRP